MIGGWLSPAWELALSAIVPGVLAILILSGQAARSSCPVDSGVQGRGSRLRSREEPAQTLKQALEPL